MKKTLLIVISALLLSCSKEEIKQTTLVTYSLNGLNQNNTKFIKTKYDKKTEYIQYEFKINDSTFGGFVLSTEQNKQYCFSFIQNHYSSGTIVETIIDNKMQGSYIVSNKVVIGKFTGTTGNFIQFKNYQL